MWDVSCQAQKGCAFIRVECMYANPVKLVKLDTFIMHWVAVYLDKVRIVNRLLLNLFKRT